MSIADCTPEVGCEWALTAAAAHLLEGTSMSRKNDRVFGSLQFSRNKHHLATPSRLISHYFIPMGPPSWVNNYSKQWQH